MFSDLIKNIKDMKRFEQILGVVLKTGFGFYIKKFNLRQHLPTHERVHKNKFEANTITPKKVRELFEGLGGAFVKLGQLLSLRPDLIPKEYCQELAKLQDNVEPVSFEIMRKVIEDELGMLEHQIKSINEKPIASASIGQVYKGKLKTGEDIIFKVQKPGIKEKFDSDIDILSKFAHMLKTYKNLPFDSIAIVDEFKKYTMNEFNYEKEAKNIDQFYMNFFDAKNIVVPRVFMKLTTKKCLTMEYVKGKNIREIAQESNEYKQKVLRTFLNCMLVQIMDFGFFHADPHPGNLFVRKYNLIFFDFGIMGYISSKDKKDITRIFLGVIHKDTAQIVRGLSHIGIANYDVDRAELEIDIRREFEQYYNKEINKINISELMYSIVNTCKKHQLKMPSHFILLAKALGTTESVIQDIMPEFNIIKESQTLSRKYMKRKLLSKNTIVNSFETLLKIKDFVSSLPDKAEDVSYKIDKFNDNITLIHKDMNKLSNSIEYSVKTITLAIVMFGFIIIGYLISSKWSIALYILGGFTLILLLYDLFKR